MYLVGAQGFAIPGSQVKGFQHLPPTFNSCLRAGQTELVAALLDFNRQGILDLVNMLVEPPAKACQALRIVWEQGYAPGVNLFGHETGVRTSS
jgi:hypothetical protein